MTDVHKVGPYVIGNTIGAGVTGKVRLAFDKNTGLQVAVKIVRKDLLKDGEMAVKLLREIAVMKVLDHEYVLHLYDYYEDLEHMFLVLEYAPNGDLYDYLIKKGILKSDEAFRVFRQIIEGHRDLKPENLLLDVDNNVKLADFGMCGINARNTLFHSSCGSPHYASPEVIEGVEYDGAKADIWSCGVILYALVAGKLPFDDNDLVKVLEKVKKGNYDMPACVPTDIQDLIAKMLVLNPDERISIDEIRKHPWYKGNNGVSLSTEPQTIEPSANKPIAGELVNDYIKTISDLGLGTVEEVETDLGDDAPSMIKTFYSILETRTRNKRVAVPPEKKSKLNRAKSEAMLPLSKVSKTFRTSSNQLSNSIRGKDAKRVESMSTTEGLVKLEESGDTSPLRTSGKDKRARFLPSWFGSSDSHLKKESKETVESQKCLTEITTELEETLDSMDATYSFSRKRDKIKAKISRDSKTIRFTVHIGKGPGHSDSAPNHMISFSRRGGDKEVFNQICDHIRRLLDI